MEQGRSFPELTVRYPRRKTPIGFLMDLLQRQREYKVRLDHPYIEAITPNPEGLIRVDPLKLQPGDEVVMHRTIVYVDAQGVPLQPTVDWSHSIIPKGQWWYGAVKQPPTSENPTIHLITNDNSIAVLPIYTFMDTELIRPPGAPPDNRLDSKYFRTMYAFYDANSVNIANENEF